MQDPVLDLAAKIVSAHVSNNTVSVDDLPRLIADVHKALVSTSAPVQKATETPSPAVPVKQSVTKEHIVCLECGGKFSMLKRHIGTEHHLTPGDYRTKWGLPGDYPMTAPAYSEVRSGLARTIGLGKVRSSEAA